ncbi:uncharacterized protein LOC115621450 [Scaptodrosophila lebanonensis]|uniref:Uncharacterized protein LOC115621450 n=1 Tax=Drosophila lebanonensis TaxID=7225 RepID=A0A6J2T769_DROLE|nr:uncharacterized protein LOC115621450 [Scaptodrosophila lebanonensis]
MSWLLSAWRKCCAFALTPLSLNRRVRFSPSTLASDRERTIRNIASPVPFQNFLNEVRLVALDDMGKERMSLRESSMMRRSASRLWAIMPEHKKNRYRELAANSERTRTILLRAKSKANLNDMRKIEMTQVHKYPTAPPPKIDEPVCQSTSLDLQAHIEDLMAPPVKEWINENYDEYGVDHSQWVVGGDHYRHSRSRERVIPKQMVEPFLSSKRSSSFQPLKRTPSPMPILSRRAQKRKHPSNSDLKLIADSDTKKGSKLQKRSSSDSASSNIFKAIVSRTPANKSRSKRSGSSILIRQRSKDGSTNLSPEKPMISPTRQPVQQRFNREDAVGRKKRRTKRRPKSSLKSNPPTPKRSGNHIIQPKPKATSRPSLEDTIRETILSYPSRKKRTSHKKLKSELEFMYQ